MAKKKAATGGIIPSQAKLAKAVEIGRSTLQRWLADDRWPFARSGPWPASDVPRIRAWAAETLRPERRRGGDPEVVGALGSDSQLERRSKIRLNLERSELIKQTREERAGRLIARDEVQRQRVERIHVVKSAMMTAAPEIARLVVGCDEETARAIIERELREICRRFADG